MREALPTSAVEVLPPRVREDDWKALAGELQRAMRDEVFLPLARLLLEKGDERRVTRFVNGDDAAYWTAFCLGGSDPNDLHCTHKFLGPLSSEAATAVTGILDAYFGEHALPPGALDFDRPELFGQDRNVPVLLAAPATATKLEAFRDLRRDLDRFRADDFSYAPHVTTGAARISTPATSYVLMRGETPVKHWPPHPLHLRLANAKRPSDTERMIMDGKDVDGLLVRVRQGRITYSGGAFRGRFNAASSRELKALGARWDGKRQAWWLSESRLTPELRHALADAESWTRRKIDAFDQVLRQIIPEKISERINARQIFDTAIGKADNDIQRSLKNVTVLPELTPERRERLAADWATNMDRWVKGFVNDEITRLRETVAQSTFGAGVRYEQLVATLEAQHGLSQRRARFIARQETNLALSSFREQRYRDAGSKEYRWRCVTGTAAHPVRPAHKALDGKIISWDDPPITSEPGQPVRRNHAGQDFNCRCFPRPIIRRS